VRAPDNQAVSIFTSVFVIVWLGAAVVTLNAKLLGGAVSFFQSVCVMGYCLFPIVVSAIVATFVRLIWVRLPISIITFAWSTYASIGFMSESQIHLQNRRALAVRLQKKKKSLYPCVTLQNLIFLLFNLYRFFHYSYFIS
jgi:hypothetical protein